jgi:hypothetical protein
VVTALVVPLLLVVGVIVLADINLIEVVLHLRAESEDDEARLLAPLLPLIFVARTEKAICLLRVVCAVEFSKCAYK